MFKTKKNSEKNSFNTSFWSIKIQNFLYHGEDKTLVDVLVLGSGNLFSIGGPKSKVVLTAPATSAPPLIRPFLVYVPSFMSVNGVGFKRDWSKTESDIRYPLSNINFIRKERRRMNMYLNFEALICNGLLSLMHFKLVLLHALHLFTI